MKVAHLTSAHPRHDIRIFVKECATLAAAGHEVTLIVADGLGEEIRNGVRFHDVGPKTGGRFARMTGTTSRVYQAALALRPDIVHFHDPELIPAAVRLKQAGIKVIYDVHEDMPRQILAKHWIPGAIRPLVSGSFETVEDWAAKRFDAVVTSTRTSATVLPSWAGGCWMCATSHSGRAGARYAVGQPQERGVLYRRHQPHSRYRTHRGRAAGYLHPAESGWYLERDRPARQAGSTAGWARVNDLGVLDRKGVAQVLAQSKIGLVTLFPTPITWMRCRSSCSNTWPPACR
jgi:hypothetical protein